MASGGVGDADPKTVEVEEEIEGDCIETTDYFFSKIGEAVPLTSDGSPFDINTAPAKPLVVSERFRLIFAAYTSGFCVAKTHDVIASAKEIKDKGADSSVQGSSFLDVPIGRVNVLSLSPDSSHLAAVVGQDIHFFPVISLLNKDGTPIFSHSMEPNHLKDILWTKDIEASCIVLTNNGKLYVGALHKPLKFVMEEVDAVERSADGDLIAVGRKNILSIFTTKFKEILQISVPVSSCVSDRTANCSIRVDGIRWVRSDSIVVGCLQQTGDVSEENYFVQVITSEDGNIINGSSKLSAVCFSDLFPGIIDDIVPFGSGPHLFMKYLEHCGLGFVSNRKNTDQHIVLFAWSPDNNHVSMVDIMRDSWLPRIELQENGDENLVLGLCIDKTSVYENVNVKIGVEEQKELPPLCILLCLTLEGKLVMFNFASIAGSQGSSLASSATSNNEEGIPIVGTSDLGGPPHLLEEGSAKQSASDLGPCDLDAKEIDNELSEIPVKKDPTPSEMNKFVTLAPSSDIKLRKDSVFGFNKEKAVLDVETCKPSEDSGHFSQGRSNQILFKNSHMEGSTVGKDIVVTDKWKVEQQVNLTDQPLGKTLSDIGKSKAEKIGSFVPQSSPSPTVSSSFMAISGVSNTVSPIFTPSTNKSTLSASILTSKNTVNSSGNFLGNLSYPSDPFNISREKVTNPILKTITNTGVAEATSGTSSFKIQSQEGVKLQNSTGQSHSVKVNPKVHSLPGHLSAEQKSSKQFCNVQHMSDELDKLLECIEEAGGCRDFCTTAHQTSFETLEKNLNFLSDRNRLWQSTTEKRLREIELLLDKTVQVLARKTHIEGILRQTIDRQYWELWNCQKLSSELDLKRQNLLNLSQELINQMIGLEEHFNALELNQYGESGGVNMVCPVLQCKRAPPRYIHSLHAIHTTMISQLAVAQKLSEFLARQMDMLSIRSLPTKEESIKKQLFESIGISLPGDYLCSPDTGKMVDSSSNKKMLISCSDAAQSESRRNQLSGLSSHDPETARRRRVSLDKNWANFDAPKTTVKRMLGENQRQNIRGSFPSLEKQLHNPFKLERSTATYPKVPPMQDNIGVVPEISGAETEGSLRLEVMQGSNISTIQNISVPSSSSQQSSPSSSFMGKSLMGNNQSTTERSGAWVGQVDMSKSALGTDLKPSASQSGHDKSTFQLMQPQLLSPSLKGSVPEISLSSLVVSATDALVLPTSGSPPISTASGSAPLSPLPSVPTLPITSIEGGSLTTIKLVNDGNSQVSPPLSSSFSVSSSFNSFKGPIVRDSHSLVSTINSAEEPPKEPQPHAVEVVAKTSPPSAPQPPQNSEPSGSDVLKFEHTTPSPSSEIPKEVASGSTLDPSRTATLASEVVSNTQSEKAPMASSSPPVPSYSGGSTCGKEAVDAAVSQEDEMEEEAPETTQTADISLESLGGFGIGSVPSTAASRSNLFGGSITGASINMSSSAFMTVPSGEFFRPASLSFQSLHTSQQPEPTFGSGNLAQQPSSGSGFGRPGQIGSGQQALGSVLGSFGQSRQLGGALPGSGFGGVQSPGGIQNAGVGGGFAGIAAAGGGFAGIGNTSGFAGAGAAIGGGFAGIGNSASGFGGAGAAATGGGFTALATSTGGFAKAASSDGGFGAFNKQGNIGFSALGGGAGSRPPPSNLFTQMRK